MLENNAHNLIHQLSEISDSVWRIKKHYLNESTDCESCQKLWQKLKQDYENHIALLQEEIKKHS
ncbi:hypothetical protein COV23_01360 [Candidatus Wolfebacteria bacterium CG10_big_fil_rev_8_21_14_0_10_31_9]|uniref:Uncharacterized protein n=1 Tax=Candidatus Wolfebacteria bacterium CG10_big_fil_rev_8_21_14_0_10_31_9 TaxID=1975070 RepID=A0A2H0RDU8_9BACT|nr:MAG: hypothetical protein COV23_01360 [Candidatus Wolfebacteria bacterium CG10_big_fil_rev_8_21_14_0_10_31_9]